MVPWKRCLIYCRFWQEQHECEEVGGVWLCWGGTGKEVCTRWLTSAGGQTERDPGTDISRVAVINIVKAELIPGVMFTNVEVKLVICQCCFCQLCVDCSGLHSCRSEKDQQADILPRQMNHISQFESRLVIYYIHEERFMKTHTLVMSSSVWHNAQLWHTCKSLCPASAKIEHAHANVLLAVICPAHAHGAQSAKWSQHY